MQLMYLHQLEEKSFPICTFSRLLLAGHAANNLVQGPKNAKQREADGVPGGSGVEVAIEPHAGPGTEADNGKHLGGDAGILGQCRAIAGFFVGFGSGGPEGMGGR
jgi:hypothetical protein